MLEQLVIRCKKKKEDKSRHRPYTLHKINSKWTLDLNIKYKIIELVEDNIRENLSELGLANDFLGTTPKVQSMKEIDKLDFVKMKNFCISNLRNRAWTIFIGRSVRFLPQI